MKTLLFSLVTIIFFSSADFKSYSPEKELQKKLIGKWKFTGKSGGITKKTEAPKSSIINIIEFKTGGKYVRYTNGEPMYQGNYQLSKAKSIYTGKDDNTIHFDPKVDSIEAGDILNITGDVLTLSDNFNDGFTTGYVRMDSL